MYYSHLLVNSSQDKTQSNRTSLSASCHTPEKIKLKASELCLLIIEIPRTIRFNPCLAASSFAAALELATPVP
jgi:hypothetical protein